MRIYSDFYYFQYILVLIVLVVVLVCGKSTDNWGLTFNYCFEHTLFLTAKWICTIWWKLFSNINNGILWGVLIPVFNTQ